jgi:hypothetical protein
MFSTPQHVRVIYDSAALRSKAAPRCPTRRWGGSGRAQRGSACSCAAATHTTFAVARGVTGATSGQRRRERYNGVALPTSYAAKSPTPRGTSVPCVLPSGMVLLWLLDAPPMAHKRPPSRMYYSVDGKGVGASVRLSRPLHQFGHTDTAGRANSCGVVHLNLLASYNVQLVGRVLAPGGEHDAVSLTASYSGDRRTAAE